jgi:hypothetical protein
MSKICYFYATKEDLLAVTGLFESGTRVKYVRFGTVTKLPPESFGTAAEIPNLGNANHPSAVGCHKFLVCDAKEMIRPRRLKTLTELDVNQTAFVVDERPLMALIGVDRFAIDQLDNPDTITFTPGGVWKEDILLHGGIGTASQSKTSEALMKRFRTIVKKAFVKVQAFYVGPQAFELLRRGKRLTISAQSPQEFDLRVL